MKKIFILIISLILSAISYSQSELSSPGATGSGIATPFLSDYQCLGVDDANLGFTRDSAAFHFSLLEIGASVYSDALQKKEIKQQFIFGKPTDFTRDQKIAAAEDFANHKFAVNLDVAWFSASFQKENFGGIGLTIREKASFNSFFNKDFAQIVFEGFHAPYFDSLVANGGDTTGYAKVPKTLGELANGSKVSGMWYREYVVGYGKRFFSNNKISIYLGAGIKYIAGYGMLDIKSENNVLTGFSALSPFMQVNYANSTPSQIAGTAMKTVGSGYGIDLGGTVELFKKFRISAALNDIGSVNWKGNVYEAADTLVNKVKNEGFYSFDMIKEMKGLIQDSTIFTWKGMESRRIGLPTNMRLGFNYQFTSRSNIGFDCYVPVNNNVGNYSKAIFSVGGNICFFKILTLSAGFSTGGDSPYVIPIGVTISSRDNSWQMGIASRDIVTFVKKNNPTISIAFGFIKFCFGKYQKQYSI